MDQKKFLTLLIQHKILTSDQAKQSFQMASTQKRSLEDILLQENYFTQESLNQWVQYFQNLQTVSESIPEHTLMESVVPQTEPQSKETSQEDELIKAIETHAHHTKKIVKPKEATLIQDAPSSQKHSSQKEIQTINIGTTEFSSSLRLANATPSTPEEKNENTPPRYTPLKILGEGGMGIVQLVKDSLLGREVALKTIKLQGNFSKRHKIMLWRLNREAEITALLGHPNIIQLYDLQKKPSGELYFTMPKIEGCTFTQILKQKREGKAYQEEDQILSIFLKVCDAISYAHSKNVIHRDLKPDNIMVGQFGEVYVMDWGIAKQLKDSDENEAQLREALTGGETEAHHTIGGMGTPGYMPPEQAENASQVKPQSDIYALGVILRQCFTLMSPAEEMKREIKKQQKTSTLAKHNPKNASQSDSLKDQISPDVYAIIQKATESVWNQRYERVQDLAEDLRRYQRNLGVSVREYSAWELLKKWIQRNKQKVALASVILLLLAGFVVYNYQQEQYRLRVEQEKIETQFKQVYKSAEEEHQRAIQNTNEDRNARSERIKNWLNALNASNATLQLKPKNLQAEELKLNITKNLLTLCFETQDYNLAEYITREIQQISLLSDKEKENYKQQVHLEKNKTLQRHLKRFEEWLNKLKLGDLQQSDREFALSEITKMQENEIYEKLIILLNEGVEYYLINKERTPVMDNFYSIMVTALGYIENNKSKEPLLQALKKLSDHILKLPAQLKRDPENYMADLVRALADSKIKGVAEEIVKIKNATSGDRLDRILGPFLDRLLEIDGIGRHSQSSESTSSSTDSSINTKTGNDYFQSGKKRTDLHDFERAVTDFTEA
ncbi:MAG: serine/threonine-protein kinase, partial [Planctomycetota bacterium]